MLSQAPLLLHGHLRLDVLEDLGVLGALFLAELSLLTEVGLHLLLSALSDGHVLFVLVLHFSYAV